MKIENLGDIVKMKLIIINKIVQQIRSFFVGYLYAFCKNIRFLILNGCSGKIK